MFKRHDGGGHSARQGSTMITKKPRGDERGRLSIAPGWLKQQSRPVLDEKVRQPR